MGEKFSVAEVAALRSELLQGGLDSFQTAELLKMFLTGRGYGISPETALDAACRIEGIDVWSGTRQSTACGIMPLAAATLTVAGLPVT